MDFRTFAAFADELVKIAGVPRAIFQTTGKGHHTLAGKKYLAQRPNANKFGQRWGQYDGEQREMAKQFGQSAKNATREALGLPTKQYAWMKEAAARKPAAKANAAFGLPPEPPRRRGRRYETGPSEAASADRSQFPVAGQSTANISSSNAVSPAYGPGGL